MSEILRLTKPFPDLTPREESLAWVRRALAEVFSEAEAAFRDQAENLVATAEQCHVRTERLVWWIHQAGRNEECGLAPWRRWCERYLELCAGLGLDPSFDGVPLARLSWKKICPQCFQHYAYHHSGALWVCTDCGIVSVDGKEGE